MRSNEILTAVVQGARRDEPSAEVQLAAMKALFNCLEFIKDNFEREVSSKEGARLLSEDRSRENAIILCKLFVRQRKINP